MTFLSHISSHRAQLKQWSALLCFCAILHFKWWQHFHSRGDFLTSHSETKKIKSTSVQKHDVSWMNKECYRRHERETWAQIVLSLTQQKNSAIAKMGTSKVLCFWMEAYFRAKSTNLLLGDAVLAIIIWTGIFIVFFYNILFSIFLLTL